MDERRPTADYVASGAMMPHTEGPDDTIREMSVRGWTQRVYGDYRSRFTRPISLDLWLLYWFLNQHYNVVGLPWIGAEFVLNHICARYWRHSLVRWLVRVIVVGYYFCMPNERLHKNMIIFVAVFLALLFSLLRSLNNIASWGYLAPKIAAGKWARWEKSPLARFLHCRYFVTGGIGGLCLGRSPHFTHSAEYMGALDASGKPHGYGTYKDTYKHGQAVEAIFRNGSISAPAMIREIGTGSRWIAVKMLHFEVHQVSQIMNLSFAHVEACVHGGRFVGQPRVTEFEIAHHLRVETRLVTNVINAVRTLRTTGAMVPHMEPSSTDLCKAVVFYPDYNMSYKAALQRFGREVALCPRDTRFLPIVFNWYRGEASVFGYRKAKRLCQDPDLAVSSKNMLHALRCAGVTRLHLIGDGMGCRLICNTIKTDHVSTVIHADHYSRDHYTLARTWPGNGDPQDDGQELPNWQEKHDYAMTGEWERPGWNDPSQETRKHIFSENPITNEYIDIPADPHYKLTERQDSDASMFERASDGSFGITIVGVSFIHPEISNEAFVHDAFFHLRRKCPSVCIYANSRNIFLRTMAWLRGRTPLGATPNGVCCVPELYDRSVQRLKREFEIGPEEVDPPVWRSPDSLLDLDVDVVDCSYVYDPRGPSEFSWDMLYAFLPGAAPRVPPLIMNDIWESVRTESRACRSNLSKLGINVFGFHSGASQESWW